MWHSYVLLCYWYVVVRCCIHDPWNMFSCVAGEISHAIAFVLVAKPRTRVAKPRENWWRVFPSSPKPLHQSEAWCTTIHMKMSLICKWMKSHFHMKVWAPRLALRKRFKEIRKWPISIAASPLANCLAVREGIWRLRRSPAQESCASYAG